MLLEEAAFPFFNAPQPVARFFRVVLCSVRRHLELERKREHGGERHVGRERERRGPVTEGEAFGAMLDHALEAWGATDPKTGQRMKREHRVFARDGWRCTVPDRLRFELGIRAARTTAAKR
jgi:hypothetical protein